MYRTVLIIQIDGNRCSGFLFQIHGLEIADFQLMVLASYLWAEVSTPPAFLSNFLRALF
jgi:hypothetical protein